MGVTGTKRNEFTTGYTPRESVNYREIRALNQSSLKEYDTNPVDFYDHFILGKKRKPSTDYSLVVGSLVDFLELDCGSNEEVFDQRFDEHFALMKGKKSTAQVLMLADELFTISQRDSNEDGVVTTDFINRFTEALSIMKDKGKYSGKSVSQALTEFNEKGRAYYDTLMANVGKMVVDSMQVDKAKKMVRQLHGDEFLGYFVNQESDIHIEVLKKVVVEFKYKGWDCKAELDFVHVDHDNKIIYRRDLKTSYDNEGFEYGYIKHSYYLQNGFYYLAMEQFIEDYCLDGYTVSPMDFLVLDTSKNCRRPLLYTTTMEHVQQALNGFWYNGSYYRGVNELIDSISWCNDNNRWDITKENFDNQGVVKLKTFK